MVDVSQKPTTVRDATASATVIMSSTSADRIRNHGIAKGDVLGIARIAGIQAVKSTSNLIPLCHAIPIEAVDVEFRWSAQNEDPNKSHLNCEVHVKTSAKTGVEMEAMTAASIVGLTVYDMIKSVDRSAEITAVRLLRKSGGKSGTFKANVNDPR